MIKVTWFANLVEREKRETDKDKLTIVVSLGVLMSLLLLGMAMSLYTALDAIPAPKTKVVPKEISKAAETAILSQPDPCGLKDVVCEDEKEAKEVIRATVTTYQAVPEQTDGDPCHAASGLYVCPAPYPVVANDQLPFGTKVEIRGTVYTVEDRFGGNYPVTKFDVLTDGENYLLKNEPVTLL